MKSWRDQASPWGKQLRFEGAEFESMMDELRLRIPGGCFRAGAGVDVDLVMMRGIGCEPDFVDLPNGILGRTLFREDGSVRIEISRKLCELAEGDVVARRRLRSTLAHECGHVACHRSLFIQDSETISLFPHSSTRARPVPIMCREEAVGRRGYTGEWWEYQANQCMAALLLPRRLFGDAVRMRLGLRGLASFQKGISSGGAEALTRELAAEFDVSLSMTVIRLETLGFIPKAEQASLQWLE